MLQTIVCTVLAVFLLLYAGIKVIRVYRGADPVEFFIGAFSFGLALCAAWGAALWYPGL